MARTQRNIYYPSDYTEAADIPADMQTMAESIDDAIDGAVQEATYDDTALKARVTINEGDIADIKSEQTTQNTNIQTNANAISSLQGTVTAQGQSIENLSNNKVDKVQGKGLSTEDFTTEEKTKLAGIEAEANKTVVDSTLSNSSENPVQNKVINASQEEQNDKIQALETDVEDLRNNSLQVSGSGSNFQLSPTAKARFIELFMKGNTYQKNNLSDGILVQGSLSEGVEVTANDRIRTKNYIEVLSNTSISVTATSNKTLQCFFAFFDTNKSFISNSGWKDMGAEISIISNTKYIRVILKNTDGSNISPNDVTDFVVGNVPNPSYPQTIHNVTGNVNVKIQNKNLGYVELEGKFRGVAQNGAIQNNVDYNSYKAEVKENTQYNVKSFQNIKNFSNLCFFDKNMNYLSGDNFTGSQVTRSFTTPTNCKYITIAVINTITQFMIVEGTINPTDFISHQEQNLPFTLADDQKMYNDSYLADDGIHHKRNSIVLNGTESYTLSTSTAGSSNYAKFNTVINKTVKTNNTSALCSHLKYKSQGWDTEGNENTFSFTTTTVLRLLLDSNQFDSIDTLKSYLANNNMTFEFELSTEEVIPYNATQQAQYNAIKQAYSYFNETNISATSSDLEPVISATAIRSINDILTRLEVLESEV